MLPISLAALSLLLIGVLLVHAPRWVWGGLLLLSLLPSAGLVLLVGAERGAAPLLLQALALGALLPSARPPKAPRVAPRAPVRSAFSPRRGRAERAARGFFRPFSGGAPGPRKEARPRDQGSPFDLWDIPGYEVLEKVGTGGMASVYRARRKRDAQAVALKVPAEAFLGDAGFLRRFHREAEVAQRLAHPNVVRTFEHGSVGAKRFMVMEFVDGPSLESYLSVPEHLTDYAASRELMQQAVRALRYIHGAGIVHRDIKPANLILRRDGVKRQPAGTATGAAAQTVVAPDALKLMDFGIAGGGVTGEEALTKLTTVGARVGTPSYMSPEQARGLRTDERSDVYSLGLVFYELLTGETAFRGGYEVVVHQQIFAMPPPPRQHAPRVPRDLEALVVRMIAKDPRERPDLAEVEACLARASLAAPEVQEGVRGSRLLCAVEARGGALRLLGTDGQLHGVVGSVVAGGGAGEGAPLPALPRACASDAEGNLYLAVLEEGPQADYPMIHKLNPAGEPLLAFGRYGMAPGEFLRPVALAAAPDGTLLVLDAETHLVQRFDARGVPVACFGGEGAGEGRFSDPRDLLVGADGDLFVLDYGNRQVQHLDAGGRFLNSWAFRAAAKGHGETWSEAPPPEPHAVNAGSVQALRPLVGIALAPTGDLYLAEAGGRKVHRLAPRGGHLDTFVLEPPAREPLPSSELGGADALLAARAARSAAGKGARPATLVAPADPGTAADLGLTGPGLTDLGVDETGCLFLAERGGTVIYKYAPSGALLMTLETYAPILQLRVDARS